MENNSTIFGKILRGELPCNKVYEDETILAFHDIDPHAKVHVLVIPKKHLPCLRAATAEDALILGHLMVKIPEIARILGLQESGYRVLSNNGPDAGQEVPHLHFHILGGEKLGSI